MSKDPFTRLVVNLVTAYMDFQSDLLLETTLESMALSRVFGRPLSTPQADMTQGGKRGHLGWRVSAGCQWDSGK